MVWCHCLFIVDLYFIVLIFESNFILFYKSSKKINAVTIDLRYCIELLLLALSYT